MAHNGKGICSGIIVLALFAVLFILAACGPAVKNPNYSGANVPQLPPVESEYRINVGDKLTIKHFYNPDLSQDVVVRPDGKISLQLVHEVSVVGLTPAKLTETLIKSYGQHLEQPEITVIVSGFAGHKIYVGGEVGQGGVKELAGPTSVLQAITMSGGFRETARANEVVVMRRGSDYKPQTIVVNMKVVMDGTDMNQDILLQPYDLVLVPRSNIANINLFVEQYLRKPISLPREFLYYWQFYDDVVEGNRNHY
ncbi:MAG: polysaccharide biosynthesis/export family protein [Syntrophobacteraceae bacterium]|nr:polysaccharide biosynthesis/export family protein [Desulfobacteraceae bacterium]